MAKKIGRYEVRKEIGRGGMSSVFLAFDPDFEREVAIKVLPRELLHDPQFRIRFEREAKTIAALEHHSIVPLYDLGEDEGQPYIVARLMSGGTFSDRIKKAHLPLDEVVNVISRIASALDAAHARGIVHRDLKPSNILIDQYGSYFLSDFGIARLSSSDGSTLTGNAIIGSPPYMSPEQIQSDGDIDGRSDIYSLGVILFEVLTGRLPYRTESPTQAIMAHLLEPVPSILEFRPDLPLSCDDVIQKAMAKERKDRFATTGEMAVALQAALFGEINGIPLYTPGETIHSSKVLKNKKGVFPIHRRWAIFFSGLMVVSLIAIWFIVRLNISPTILSQLPPVLTETVIESTKNPTKMTVLPEEVDITPSKVSIIPNTTPQPLLVSPSNIVGQADKIAMLRSKDVWVMDIDGKNLQQITDDGAEKLNLHWGLDGKSVEYILGQCVLSVNIQSKDAKNIICFGEDSVLSFFEVSPNRNYVALGINNKLYIISYDMNKISKVRFRADLQDLAPCKDFSPNNYTDLLVKEAHWGDSSNLLAVTVLGSSTVEPKVWDSIQLLDVSKCQKMLPIKDQFPIMLAEKYQVLGERFIIRGYKSNPHLQSFNWDGKKKFVFVSNKKNDGYGDLYIYHNDLQKIESEVNPIDKVCCYRDPQWSPDGKFLLFAFQDERLGKNVKTHLFYLPYATFGIGLKYEPIQMPDDFFTDPNDKFYPVLRPSQVSQ